MAPDLIIGALWRALLRRRVYRLLPLVVLLLAALLRFHLLDQQSLWSDEGNTLRLVERAVPDLIAAASRDIHPPGYYLLLKGWFALTGEREFTLRAFSALAGVLTVACVYALGKALFAPGAGLLAALLVAVNSFSVYYGQEARMYALVQLIAAAALLCFVRWLAGQGRSRARASLLLAVLNAAGLYVHYSYPAVMAAQGAALLLWLAWWRRIAPLGQFIALNLLTVLLFAPQLGTALMQVAGWPRTGQDVDLGEGLAVVARWLVYGNTSGVPGQPVAWWVYAWPALFAAAALLPDWTGRRALPSGWRRLFPIIALIVIIVPFFALGLFREANLKFLLPAQLAAALLIGRGLWLLWESGSPTLSAPLEVLPRFLAAIGLVAILSFSAQALDNLYHHPAYFRADYRAVARLIAEEARPGDAIILDAPNQQEVFTYYYRGEAPIYPLPHGLGGDDDATRQAVEAILAEHRHLFALYWGEAERDPNRIVEKTLTANAFEVSAAWYGDVRFVRYAVLPEIGAPFAVGASFGEAIRLEHAALSGTTLQHGDVLGLRFGWRASAPLLTRYRVTVQLLDAEGRLAAQRDSEPGSNLRPTTTWQPGEVVSDTHGLLIPPGLAPGAYTLIVALYDLDDPSARLSVGDRDHLEIAAIRVE